MGKDALSGRSEGGRGAMASAMRFAATLALLAGATISVVVQPLAAQSVPIETVTLPAELDRVLRDYEVAWRAGDEAALAALFTETGFVMQGGRAAARGRNAIQAAYTTSQGPLVLNAWDYSVEGDTGFIIGGFALAEGDPEVGKFVLTLRRVGERWFIHSDMDNGGGRGG